MPDFARNFSQSSTTSDVTAGLDLSGHNAIVTGASTGLGAETAWALAAIGANVTLAVRNVEKGEGVAEAIRADLPNATLDVSEVELSVPDSVRAFAKRYLERGTPLHRLVNNAGVMACPLERNANGWEIQFATNHIGHFLLTALLAPALKAGAPARVVNLTSAGHRLSPVVFDDIQFERREYDKWSAYGQAKTANIWFSNELNRRLSPQGVTSNAVHPGGIVTELGRHLEKSDIEELMSRAPSGGIQWKTVESGAATSVWAATAPELEGRGGLYLEDCGVGEIGATDDSSVGYDAHAFDTDGERRLWQVSEELVGETFDFGT
jgi:NAD(P)-dependent dehydrogenase (short-subunit alcohol dehydrogenase family)